MDELDRIRFVGKRDRHQREGEVFWHYNDNIGDSECLNSLFPGSFLFNRDFPNEGLRILDLCCGPGMAGRTLDEQLRAYGYEVPEVIFVDIQAERLSEIPNDSRYDVVHKDVIQFMEDFQSAGRKVDIIVLRNAIYYFRPDERERLFSGITGSLNHPGCFLFSSYGYFPHEPMILTGLHEEIYSRIFTETERRERGRYDRVGDLMDYMKSLGFYVGDQGIGSLRFTTQLFADKYGLDEEAKKDIERWLLSLPADVRQKSNMTETRNAVEFASTDYTIEFFTFRPPGRSPEPPKKRTADVYIEDPSRDDIQRALSYFDASHATELNLRFSDPSYKTILSSKVRCYGRLFKIRSMNDKSATVVKIDGI